MHTLNINGQDIQVADGSMVLDAARQLGIAIPTLCSYQGCKPFTSCMVCVVEDMRSGVLLPSCCAPVTDGMRIETNNDRVRDARTVALELLLSDHLGDCDAPCTMVCPAHMNIPLMLRLIAAGDFAAAARTARERIALPAVLGYICPAPCEKVCRRGKHDEPLAICLLKRFAGEFVLQPDASGVPDAAPENGKKIAVIGAGPTGLAAAYYLQCAGYGCTVYDDHAEPGGMLRYGVPVEALPRSVLDADIDVIRRLGVSFVLDSRVGKDISAAELIKNHAACIIAAGTPEDKEIAGFGVSISDKGIAADLYTGQTTASGIFACGNAVHTGKMAVRAVASGRNAAIAAMQFIEGKPITGPERQFNCAVGRLNDGEINEYVKEGSADARTKAADESTGSFTGAEARREAARCLHCDCRKPDTCRLRAYATEYGVKQSTYKGISRNNFEQIRQHAGVVYEPGKCIKCGICVRITEKAGETLGLTFIGRGFDVSVRVPFNETLERGLATTAEECVQACPTGALAKVTA